MPGIEDLVLGPVIGLVLPKLYEEIKQAMVKTKTFKIVLKNLHDTVIQVQPKIDEISRMEQEHNGFPKQEIVVFRELLEKGIQLVATCAVIPRWNMCKRRKYAKRLADMDSALRKIVEVQFQAEQLLDIKKILLEMAEIKKKLDRMNIQMPEGVAGGGESSNAAATPAIGRVLQQFYEEIKQAMDKTKKFNFVLNNLKDTIIQVKPMINEISRMNQEHNDYPKQEIAVFLEQLEKGKQLVATCADIPRWNKYKRRKYAKRFADMDSSLHKLLEFQFQAEQVLDIKKMLSEMAAINKKLDRMNIQIPEGVSGGGESSNAAATDQSSDDQTAGRRSCFEMHLRRKKENSEIDIKLGF